MELKGNIYLVIVVLAILATNYNVPFLVKAQYPYLPPPPPPSSSSSSSSSCVNRLYPCMRYLNGTGDLPDSCCDPLKSVIKSDPQCLCRMISTQGAFQAQLLGINISQVELLPERCGQRVNPIGCVLGATRSKNSVQSSASVCSFQSLLMFAAGAILMIIIL